MDLKTLALPLGAAWAKIAKCIPAIVLEVEKEAKDGKITAAERKELATNAIAIVASEFGFKLSWLVKWVISIIIDSIAKKLPSKDINVPDLVLKVSGTF